MKASLIIIGNEILSGRTQDKNLSYLANWLNEIGIQLAEVRVIRDCLLYTSPSPRDRTRSRMPSSA